MRLIAFAALSLLAAGVAYSAVNAPVGWAALRRFGRRQQIDITPFNGSLVIAHLQVTQRWWWIGVAIGFAWCVSGIVGGNLRVDAYPFVAGGFAGVLIAGFQPRSRRRAPLGLRLAHPFLVLIWQCIAILACGLALSTVARSFWLETPVAARLWAVLALALVLAVQLLVRDLHTRPLQHGPADLVGAELAIRSRSARSLLAVGGTVTLWTAFYTGLPALPGAQVFGFLITYGLPLLAWVTATLPWSPSAWKPGKGGIWATTTATALVGVGLSASWLVWGQEPTGGPHIPYARVSTPVTEPFLHAYAAKNPAHWRLVTRDRVASFPEAVTLVGIRPAPFLISGDGHRLVYLDKATRRLVHSDFTSGDTLNLTERLADDAIPVPALSHDGRFVTLTGTSGVELIDSATGTRTRLNGIARVIGVGQDTVVATTGRRALRPAPDTELLTLDHGGAVRSRIPFDPTLDVRLAPDASALAVLTYDEVVTMDSATGVVRERHDLRLPERKTWKSMLSWDGGHRLLVLVDRNGPDKQAGYLVDPSTGKAKPYEGLPEEGSVVGGSVS